MFYFYKIFLFVFICFLSIYLCIHNIIFVVYSVYLLIFIISMLQLFFVFHLACYYTLVSVLFCVFVFFFVFSHFCCHLSIISLCISPLMAIQRLALKPFPTGRGHLCSR